MTQFLPRSRRLVVLVVVALLALVSFAAVGHGQTRPAGVAHVTVTINKFKFMPPTLTIKRGTVVRFVNNDGPTHSVTADKHAFNIAKLAHGQSATITFKKAGTFTYHCTFHPFMTAKIIVK